MTPDGEAEEAVDAAHPLGVAAGQVVVDRDDVDALAAEGVQVGGQRGHQGLALARLHLADLALVQHHAADELHVVVAHVQHALAGLAHHGEGLRQQVVERFALLDAGAEARRWRRAGRRRTARASRVRVRRCAPRAGQAASGRGRSGCRRPWRVDYRPCGGDRMPGDSNDLTGRRRRPSRNGRGREGSVAAGLPGAREQELERVQQPVVDPHFVVQVRGRWPGRWRRRDR